MAKFLDKSKEGSIKAKEKAIKTGRKIENYREQKKKSNKKGYFGEDLNDEDYDEESWKDDFGLDHEGKYDDMAMQPAQRPESFHHFILENQYKDLERSIRGFKDVFDKETQQWKTIRKKEHCFTDEEAEEILRTAQSHLATDIKLGRINSEIFGELMNAIYDELAFLFESIAEYRYGRYGDYEKQYQMKLQNHKIFLELFNRIEANYSRAIGGMENKYTHDSVKGQESLQQGDYELNRKRYS
ncbi:MAG: hypothetical protein ACOC56_03475 [Atribacterota bacterium]